MKFSIPAVLFFCAVALIQSPCSCAEDTAALIAKLASTVEADRAAAIEALQKLGDAAVEPLRKAEADQKLEPQQLILVRKILGDRLVATTPLKPVDLKSVMPFGADPEKNIPGDPNLSINRDTKLIVMNGQFVLEQGPLEYLVVVKHGNAKLHESVTGIFARPRDVCYALLACAYTYANAVNAQGNIVLPKEAGILISVEYEWEPVNAKMGMLAADGSPIPSGAPKKLVRVPIEFFSWNAQTEKTMKQSPFAFTGSKFEKDNDGKMIFIADIEMSIVAVKFDQYALMNTLLDTKEIDPQHSAGYSINRFATPAKGTKCRVIFEPWKGGELTKPELTDTIAGREQTGVAPPPAKKGE